MFKIIWSPSEDNLLICPYEDNQSLMTMFIGTYEKCQEILDLVKGNQS